MTTAELASLIQLLVVVAGGLAAVAVMRTQIKYLGDRLGELTVVLRHLESVLDLHEKRLSQLEFRTSPRSRR